MSVYRKRIISFYCFTIVISGALSFFIKNAKKTASLKTHPAVLWRAGWSYRQQNRCCWHCQQQQQWGERSRSGAAGGTLVKSDTVFLVAAASNKTPPAGVLQVYER